MLVKGFKGFAAGLLFNSQPCQFAVVFEKNLETWSKVRIDPAGSHKPVVHQFLPSLASSHRFDCITDPIYNSNRLCILCRHGNGAGWGRVLPSPFPYPILIYLPITLPIPNGDEKLNPVPDGFGYPRIE
ncbi:hypothetical protein MTR_3g022610 [Medicago truncatula]|uniref:Uncharacterized protein n=1 Tax=Medicago truncatula TaxID=3880 RepID=G7J1J9_MEDTR|nr:hypothetical protein MTR_3g022610 [Medicago truncatula]